MLPDALPNRWYPIFTSAQLRAAPVVIERLGERLVLWRDNAGVAHAALDRCPHRGVSFKTGEVNRAGELACPYHGFTFGPSGACAHAPVLGRDAKAPAMSLDLRQVTEAHGLLWAFTGVVSADTPPPPWFDGLGEDLRRCTDVAEEWPVHHVQLTQSMLDVYHVGVLHRRSVPGTGKVLTDFKLTATDDEVHTEGRLGHDGKPGDPFVAHLRLPGLVHLDVGLGFHLLIAVTPIDTKRSWVWARYELRLTPIPQLDGLIAWLGAKYDFSVLQHMEDLPLLTSIEPAIPEPGCDRLIAPDAGAAAYLRLYRRQLNDQSEAAK
ncbi:Rieske 2Fe-2S domain-containing protein [Myxococcota bacterium]|nr:Rieske 2Fe-2S domain-containing protein [Myxococcota bacterium]